MRFEPIGTLEECIKMLSMLNIKTSTGRDFEQMQDAVTTFLKGQLTVMLSNIHLANDLMKEKDENIEELYARIDELEKQLEKR